MRRLLVLLAALTLTACGQAPPAQEAGPATAPAGFPVTIQNCGRTLTFDRPPVKVVTGYHPSLETLFALGLSDRVTGRTNFSESAFLPGHRELYARIPEISPTIMLPQKEVMLAQGADFVLDNAMASFDAAGGYATVAELDEDTFTDLHNLGRIFGVPDRAAKLAAGLRAGLDDVRRRVGGRPPVKVLATDGGRGPVNAYGGAGLTHQLITAAGGRNVLEGVKGDYTEVSVEQVSAAQPEAVLVSEYATLRGETTPTVRAKTADTFAVIRNSPAAKARRVLALPVAAQHPGYRNLLAVADIARFLHPGAFPS